MIYIVTGNKNKFEKAQQELNEYKIQIEQIKLDILEPQSDDSKFIADYKANQAFEQTKKPVIITDTNWSIPSLKGFPGPYMKYIGEWFESDDFLSLIKNKNDRNIIFEDILVFKDLNQTKVFISMQTGEFLKESKREGHPIDKIVTFRKDKMSITECFALGISSFDEESDSVWRQFGKWYASLKK